MTEDDVLQTILTNEGGFKNDPEDAADPTNFGITAAIAGEWLKLGRRADAVEMQTLITAEVAKAIYRKRYIEDPGFTHENVASVDLLVQLIDFGVNSGPSRAIRWLQRIIECHTTGIMDDETKETLQILRNAEGRTGISLLAIVNDALVAARLFMIDTVTDASTVSKKYEEGLESRALSFFLAKPQPESVNPSKASNA